MNISRAWITVLLVVVSIVGTGRVGTADHDVEHRIAQFWARLDAMQPSDYLSAADLGQWALNVIERNPRARTTVADFRQSTAGMQEGMDRAGPAAVPPEGTSTPVVGVEARVADFWKRVDSLRPSDYLSAADLGHWALNVIERNPRARTTVADFRQSTAGMQGGIERAGLAPASRAGQEFYRANFDGTVPLQVLINPPGQAKFSVAGGALNVAVTQAGGTISVNLPAPDVREYVANVEMTIGSEGGSGFRMAWRVRSDPSQVQTVVAMFSSEWVSLSAIEPGNGVALTGGMPLPPPGTKFLFTVINDGQSIEILIDNQSLFKAAVDRFSDVPFAPFFFVHSSSGPASVAISSIRYSALVGASPSPAPTPASVPYGTLPLPSFIRLDVGADVTATSDLDAIVDGLARAQSFYLSKVGQNPIVSEVVKVYNRIAIPGVPDPGFGVCCPAFGGRPERIEIRVNDPGWIQSRDTRLPMHLLRQLIMAHEHWHLWQHALGCPSQNYNNPVWPVWMTEGGAEFMQWQVLLDANLVAPSALAGFEGGMVQEVARLGPVPLQTLEAPGYGNRSAYGLGYFATKRLVARSGYNSLRTFCLKMGTGATWQAAFSDAFGISPNAFYADFELWRANGYQ